MAKSGLTIEPTKGSNLAHNNREHKIDYLVEGKFWCDRTEKEAQEYLTTLRHEAVENYTKRTGQKMQIDVNDNKYLWSASVNLNQEHTIEDLKDLAKGLEEKHGWQCVQCAVHFDEGHINERGVIEYNRHGHLEFFMVSKEGKTVFKKKDFRQKDMSELQTFVAERLKMERGKIYHETGEYKQHLKPQAFKATKRELEAVKTLANEKDLKEAIAPLKAEAKTRPEHAKIEQLVKDLKAQLKNKDLTIDDLQKQINAHKTLVNDLELKNKALDKEIAVKDEKINSRANMSDLYIKESESEVLQSVDSVLKHDTSYQTLYEKKGGFLPSYDAKDVHVVNDAKGFKASILGVFNKLKEKFADLKERFERLSRDHDKLMFDHKDLTHKYENVNQDRWEANNKVARLERELEEAKAELKALKGQRLSRYDAKQINEDGDMEYTRKSDAEFTSNTKEKRANIAQKESEIAHIEQKLGNAKEASLSDIMEHNKDALEQLNKHLLNPKEALAKARQQKANVEQMKQNYYQVNEIPTLDEDKPKPQKKREPFVRS